jgi:1,4-dihydroxy-2-naphthoate octaprenyltransferase
MHTEIGQAAGTSRRARRRSLRDTLSVYARLGNMKVYIQWLPPLIGWSLVADPLGISLVEAAALGLFVLACLTGTAAGGALDDVQGFRDGIDQQTYAVGEEGGGFQAKTDRSVKPLVTGELTVAAAHRFGIGIAIAGVALGTAAIVIAPQSPWWLVPLWAVWVFACSQYGYGLKVSYWGPAELLLGSVIAAIVCFPVLFLEGALSWTAALQAYLIGTLLSQVTLFSSLHDREVDAAAGRRTLAARLSPRAYRLVVVGWFATGWAVAVGGVAAGALEPWLLLAWLPVCAMQVAQLVLGLLRGDPLTARRIGWHAFDVAFVGFVLVNLSTG